MQALGKKRELRRRMEEAKGELQRLEYDLRGAYSLFNHTSDPQLLEACILEISALRKRYSCALKNIKTMNGD